MFNIKRPENVSHYAKYILNKDINNNPKEASQKVYKEASQNDLKEASQQVPKEASQPGFIKEARQ